MSDPYIHCEEKLKLTRKCLEVILKNGFGVAIQNKSDRIFQHQMQDWSAVEDAEKGISRYPALNDSVFFDILAIMFKSDLRLNGFCLGWNKFTKGK